MGVSDGLHPEGKRGGSKRALGLALGACGLVLVLVLMLGVHFLNVTPVVTIPQPTLPSPNAFDDFQAATEKIPAGQTKAAADALWANLKIPSYKPREKKPSEAERAELVRQYVPALEQLRKGLDHPYLEPPARSFTHTYPHFAQFRDLARVLRLEGQVRARQGDWSGAMESSLDNLHLGAKIPHGGVMIGQLVGIAIQSIGRKDTWEIAGHLSGPEARAAIQRLARIREERFPYWRTLEEEKWMVQAGLLEIMRRPDWYRQYLLAMGPGTTADWGLMLRLMATSKSTLVNEYSNYMDRSISRAKVPYAARPAPIALPTNSLVSVIVPVFEQAHFASVKSEVLNDLLLLSLALRAYQAEQGQPPRALSALVPRYLKALPEDPFAPDGKFRYRVERGRPLLYSIGPDATDDGGRPVRGKRTSADPAVRHMVEADSTGDIVAGVNIQ